MRFFYLLFLSITILLSGCGSSNAQAVKPTPKKDIQHKEKVKEGVKESSVPKWINNPDFDGNIGAVGIVKKMKNKKKQKYLAKKLAVASLQETKRVMIKSNTLKTDSDLIQETTQTSSHYNSDELVQKDEYSDAEYYYIWIVIKK